MTITPILERLVWQCARRRCEYCQFPADAAWLPFQIDHIISEKLHGPTKVQNLALSCETCNSHKGPLIIGYWEGRQVRLFHPRTDRWSDHFEWEGPELVAKTDVAAATIDVLKMNQADRVAVRRALMEEGVFPPED